ncbi:MAG: hypothetical protein IMF06_01595, partial [Proteobacteria bacterium]|nr:hypothetical protein [Pseudomonadota bacterium]
MLRKPAKLLLPAALAFISAGAFAQGSSFTDAWNLADLYENERGDYFRLSGRLHADAATFDASQGDYNDIRWRRFRFGFKARYGA